MRQFLNIFLSLCILAPLSSVAQTSVVNPVVAQGTQFNQLSQMNPAELTAIELQQLKTRQDLLDSSVQNIQREVISNRDVADTNKKNLDQVIANEQVQNKTIGEMKNTQINLDFVWIIMSGILVFFMQAGFALLESGAARSKNMVNVLMKNYMDMCVGAIGFSLIGFGLMFGINETGWFGTSKFLLLDMQDRDYVMFFFQLMFASTAATIVSGAIAERTKFMGYLIGSIVICALIYPVFGAWAWGGSIFADSGNGWLRSLGFIDFAGSTVVHSLGGWAALAAAIVVGPRIGRFGKNGKVFDIPAHNTSLMALGTFILWFSWFGFNGGSTLVANASIGHIILNTHMSGCAGAVTVMLIQYMRGQKILISNVLNGGIAGLVGITAGAATMDFMFAMLTGCVAGLVMYLAQEFLLKMKIDDVVGAFPVHGAAGIWGTLAAGMFFRGDLFNPEKIMIQLLGIAVCAVWAFGVSYAVYKLISVMGSLRASPEHERAGLDYTEHAELGYPEFQKESLYTKD